MDSLVFQDYRIWVKDQAMPKGERAVLLAGLDLFAKYGYNGTSTAQISELAQVSQATIFKYFKTKKELLFAIIKPIFSNLVPFYRDNFLQKMDDLVSLEDFVHYIVSDRFAFIKTNADAITIIFTELLTSEEVGEMFNDVLKKSRTVFSEHFGRSLQRLEINPELDVATVFRTFIGQLLAYFLQRRLVPQLPHDEAHDLRLIEQQIIRAIQK